MIVYGSLSFVRKGGSIMDAGSSNPGSPERSIRPRLSVMG